MVLEVTVYDKPSFGDHVSEGVIHEMLECGWRVGEAEEHDGGFNEAFMGDKGGFPLVAIFDVDIVIAPTDVKFGKQFGIFELINEVRDKGERVSISNSVFIQISVILVGTVLRKTYHEGRRG